jgi:putative SOS response-associated peptidase YedK
MCGRYTNTGTDQRRLAERFGLGAPGIPPETLGRFNVCPSETILVVVAEAAGRRARGVRWGLLPWWGKGPQPLNARAETAAAKPLFARLLERGERRCLVVADGWYEWLRPEARGAPRTPFHYRVDGGEPFAFAGLWDPGRGEPSACVLTTTANGVCRPVHDRMPCVLAGPDEEAAWISGEVDASAATDLLRPLPDERVIAGPANPAVNRAGVEGPELLVAPTAPATLWS